MSTALLERPGRPNQTSYLGPLLHWHFAICSDCGRLFRHRDETCPDCQSDALEPIPQTGEIYSYTTVRQSASTFVLALIRLSSGKLVTAKVVGADRELKIGMAVHITREPDLYSESKANSLCFSPLAPDYVTAG